jgi:hypothetical protein
MSKISALPVIDQLDGAETVPVLSRGVTKRASMVQFAGLVAEASGGYVSSGNVLPNAHPLPQPFNGALPILGPFGTIGYEIPAGSDGQSSLIQFETPIAGNLLAGAVIRLIFTVALSDPFTRDVNFGGLSFRPEVGAPAPRTYAQIPIKSRPGTKSWAVDFVVGAQDRWMSPFFQLRAATKAMTWETIRGADLRWSVVADVPHAANDMNVERRVIAALDDAALPGTFAPPRRTRANYPNGAVAIVRSDGVTVGMSMVTAPAHSGYDSHVQILEDLDPKHAGAVELFEIVVEVSDPFTRVLERDIVIDQVGGGNDDATVDTRRFAIFGGYLRWTFTRTIRPGNKRLTAILRVTADQSPATPEFFRIVSIKRRYLTSVDPLRTPEELNREIYNRNLLASAASSARDGIVPTEIIVRADGTGDYPTIETANAAIDDASAIKPYAIRVLPGLHTGFSGLMSTKDHVDIVGTNPRRCILYYASAVDASAATLAQSYIAYVNSRTIIRSVRAIVERARYGFHPDDNNLRNKNSETRFFDAIVEHRSNVSANQAAQALGGVAIGAGVDSGSLLSMEACETSGPWGGGLAAHNNIDSERPAMLVCRLSRSLAHEPGKHASVQSLGSGQADVAFFENCVLPGGRFIINNSLWLTQREDYRPANRSEWRVYGAGNTPAAVYVQDPARALRITSADATARTNVAIVDGGSANTAVWGQVLLSDGGVGRPADAYGTEDVSGSTAGMTLGRRLGNCAVQPKSFQVSFQGGTLVTVSFTTDLTNASNADVLAIINAALGNSGRADLWAVAKETERPLFLDEEYAPINSTGTAQPRGMVLAFDGAMSRVRPMTADDEARLFAGIVYAQDNLHGRAGRVKGSRRAVKNAGHIALEDVLVDGVGLFGETLMFGEGLGIGATPGRLVKNAAVTLLTVAEVADVANGFTPALSLAG